MNIFPIETLSETEEALLAEKLSDPLVKKYLHMRAYNIGADLAASVPDTNEPAEEWLRKTLYLRGQLKELDTLLDIKPVTKSNQG